MRDSLPPVTSTSPAASRVPGTVLNAAAMSVEDYARVVQARARFVDFLLAPAREQLAAAA